MNKTKRCDIVIPVWNLKDITEQCVESIIRHTRFPYRIIIVDNASKYETRLYLASLTKRTDADIRVIRNEENLGNSKAANQGIRASDADYVCILDNDTIVTDRWLEEMVGATERNDSVGVVNPLSNYGAKKPRGKSWDDVSAENYRRNRGIYIETAAAIGFCFLITRSAVEKVGLWPEDYGPGYFEDTEYSIRAIEKGYKVVIAQGAYVVHLEHSSFRKTGTFDELFRKNQKIFYEKYGSPQRHLYIFTGKETFGLEKDAYDKAQKRCWIWLFIQQGLSIDLPRHAYIKVFTLPEMFFGLNCVFRALKKKKRFNTIYSDSTVIARRLIRLKALHRAEVVCEGIKSSV